MTPVREYPAITTEDIMGLDFTTHPTELPLSTLWGHPAAIFARGLPYSVRAAIERAVCDLGYRWGVVGASVEIRTARDAQGAARHSIFVKIQYRGGA